MYARLINPPSGKSFFLFGPRGTGKTTWLRRQFPNALYLDLLEAELFNDLTANPQSLENFIAPGFKNWIILDEVQRIPSLLNEVHRLIENKKLKFILTGSSARKLRQKGVNLLAGRALTYYLYPLTAFELKKDFSVQKALKFGQLPAIFSEPDKKKYLESYVMTYLEQEIQQEGITRNLGAFARFLETASFSQGQVLNVSEVARDCSVNRKVVESYFSALYDLRLAYSLRIFTKKAKRRLIGHSKFYFFDVGIYQTIRPRGPLEWPQEKDGVALESLVLQELKAVNDYLHYGYELFFWRTSSQIEVDFVLYGPRGIKAIEVKSAQKIQSKDLRGLRAFLNDYPEAKGYILYGGKRIMWKNGIECIPVELFFANAARYL